MKLSTATIRIGVLLLAAGCAASRGKLTPAPDTVDALLSVALQRALVEPRDLPDIGLVEGSEEIVVRSTIRESSFQVGSQALPTIEGKKLLLLSESEIQARAAERGDVYFVAVDGLEVSGDDAELRIGVEVATSPARPMLCCCSAKVQYSRVGGAWVYRGSTEFVCS